MIFGEVMESWRTRMPEGMLLRSSRRASQIADPDESLTVTNYERSSGRRCGERISREDFIDYGCWFARHAAPDLDSRKVRRITPLKRGFKVTLSDGQELTAGRVVVASGLLAFGYRPQVFNGLPPTAAVHSSELRDLERLRGAKVLVVGGGQSALEYAALLSEHDAEVEVLARRKIAWLPDTASGGALIRLPVPPTGVGGRVTGWLAAAPDVFQQLPNRLQKAVDARCMRPQGASWLQPRLRHLTLTEGRSAVAASMSGDRVQVQVDDGSKRVVDKVVLATGYGLDVGRYEFLPPQILGGLQVRAGHPVLGRGLQTSIPGLYFVGAPAALSYGPVMRFVVGSFYAAPALAHHIGGRRRRGLRMAYR
jgi:cation diffusion facilitator CzcD-associated flavoprotein CzcO